MGTRAGAANVASVDMLEAFRANLIVYQTKASRAFEEIGDEVRQTRLWLEGEQRAYWEGQIRLRNRRLDQAQQEYFSARLSKRRSGLDEKKVLVRAKEMVREAEQKLKAVKHWVGAFDSQVSPLLKRLDGLDQILSTDLPKAIMILLQHVRALETYAEVRRPSGGAAAEGEPELEEEQP